MRYMKRNYLTIFLTILMFFAITIPAFAYTISIDGKTLDADVVVVDGRSMIPMRAVGNALGLKVDWDGNTQSVLMSVDDSKLVFGTKDGSYQADIKHSDSKYNLQKQNGISDLKAKNINGSNYVPVRLICDTFGAPLAVSGDVISIGKIFTAGDASAPKVEKFVHVKTQTQAPAPTPVENSSFKVYYLDVGEADAALVQCDGKNMLIDGGNVSDSSFMYSFLKNHNVSHIDVMVASHAHEDHAGGLAGALNYATVGKVYCPTLSYDTEAFANFKKYVEKQSVQITVPKAGDTFTLGSAKATILGPVKATTDENNKSLIVRVEYGSTSFLFTGDAETAEEQDVLDSGRNLESTVLKVAHHGSENSTGYLWLRTVNPKYAVISVGKNGYGHPTEKVLSRLRDAGVKTYRTDMQGTITCESDGKTVKFAVERNANADTLSGAGAGSNANTTTNSGTTAFTGNVASNTTSDKADYVLNTNTHKFHYKSCSSVGQMSEKNKAFYTGTRDEVCAMGYDPCGRCNP